MDIKITRSRPQGFAVLCGLAALVLLTAAPVLAQQASITLKSCNNGLCNTNDTAWTLAKTPDSQSKTGDATIGWSVQATKGATTDNIISVNGYISVQNTGTADATIGNIVVNLQKPRTGPNTGACRNVPWVSAAADVATANSGDAATLANLVAAASTEVVACNAAQGAVNYTVSGAQGTFSETTGASGSLEFTDADSNTLWAISPEQTIAPGGTVNLLYTAEFDNTALSLPAGSSVRAEVIVTFGNAGARGGSGATESNIDIDGNGCIDNSTNTCPPDKDDEAKVRSVPCRVTSAIPALVSANSTVTLSDTSADVSVTVDNVALGDFSTDIGGGTGSESISADTTRSVSNAETCTPPGSATITNTAHLDGADVTVTVQGPQIGTDPNTGAPIYQNYAFTCVEGVELDDSANAGVTCEAAPPTTPNACTYTKGGYAGSGGPGQLFDNNFLTEFPSGLTIGIEDGAGSKHDATWAATTTGRSNLKTYLTSAATGPSTALTADTDDATSTTGGSLPRQTATLALNVEFDLDSNNQLNQGNLDSSTLCHLVEGSTIGWTLTAAQATALNGKSVSQVLTDANNALGGNGLPSYVGSFGDLNQLVTALNESFDNCTASRFANAYLCPPTP